MRIYLETERLILRELTDADVDNLVELDADPAVTKYINGGQPTSREVVVEHVIPRILNYYKDLDRQGLWAAIEKTSGAFMGWFHLRPNRLNQAETELGYRLKQKYWGQGIATEGSLALVKKGFEDLGASVIVAITDPDNFASRRVMEKVGMHFEKEEKESDGFIVVKYRLERSEYYKLAEH